MEEQVNIPVLLLIFDGVTFYKVLSVFWLYASKFEGGDLVNPVTSSLITNESRPLRQRFEIA